MGGDDIVDDRGVSAGLVAWLSKSPTLRVAAKAGDIATKLAVFVGVLWWMVEIPDRAKETHYRAWAIINSASDRPGDSGRIAALQDLNADDESLENIDLSHAYLRGIQLPGARLRKAKLRSADLKGANFGCRISLAALLTDRFEICSDFREATLPYELSDVNFSGATFLGLYRASASDDTRWWGLQLSGARLISTHFRRFSVLGCQCDNLEVGTSWFEYGTFDVGHYANASFTLTTFSHVDFRMPEDEFKSILFCGAAFSDATWSTPRALISTPLDDSFNTGCDRIQELRPKSPTVDSGVFAATEFGDYDVRARHSLLSYLAAHAPPVVLDAGIPALAQLP